MSCLGNTIARSLALVSVGTIAAFVHWAAEPFQTSIARPAGFTGGPPAAQPAGPADPAQQGAPPGDTPEQTGGDTPEPAQGADGAGGAPQPFDPLSLDTEINTAQAYQLWLTGEVTFIDARAQKEYLAGHIPYSYLVPAESLGAGRLGDMMELGGVFPESRVVVYCEGGSCDASHLVALRLQELGFDKIHIDTDGFPAWQAAGYEVETGPDMVLGDVP